MIIKSFFDGANIPSGVNIPGQYLTLAVLSGTKNQWVQFDNAWAAMLRKQKVSHLHTTDAAALRGDFSEKKGWTKTKVQSTIEDCVALLKSSCAVEEKRTQKGDKTTLTMAKLGLRPSVIQVNVTDFARAQSENKDLNHITDVCTFQAFECCARWQHFLAAEWLQLYFDRGEPFYGHILDRLNNPRHRTEFPEFKRRIPVIAQVKMSITPGIQAADLLCWSYTHDSSTQWHSEIKKIHLDHHVFDYDSLILPDPLSLQQIRLCKLPKRKPLRVALQSDKLSLI